MTIHTHFTEPSDLITTARQAIDRLQRHFARVVGPLDLTADLSSLAIAVMSLESVHPPYRPLPPQPDADRESALEVGLDVEPDPRADLDAAIAALIQASTEATTARETLRLAYVIRDLRELENSPYLDARPAAPSCRP